MRIVLLIALAGFAFQSARAQTTCEIWTVDPANSVYETGCIFIGATGIGANDLVATVEVSSDNYN
jgi:hypothetical protein